MASSKNCENSTLLIAGRMITAAWPLFPVIWCLLISMWIQPKSGRGLSWTAFLAMSESVRLMSYLLLRRSRKMHHETKTDIYQHSGSSVRVPIDRDVRSASTGLSLYQSDHDF